MPNGWWFRSRSAYESMQLAPAMHVHDARNHRGPLMARPCTCDDCPRCTLYHTDERYCRLWEPNAPPIRLGECKHLGGEVRRVGCGTCKGRVELKVFTCAVHGACTLRKKTEQAACCDGCK